MNAGLVNPEAVACSDILFVLQISAHYFLIVKVARLLLSSGQYVNSRALERHRRADQSHQKS